VGEPVTRKRANYYPVLSVYEDGTITFDALGSYAYADDEDGAELDREEIPEPLRNESLLIAILGGEWKGARALRALADQIDLKTSEGT
jgi:hypothetical protein